MMEVTVGDQYETIQETLDAIPYEQEAVVHVPMGVWHEKLSSRHKSLTLIGEGEDKTSLIYEAASLDDPRSSASARFSGEKLVLKELNVSNYAGWGPKVGSAVALLLDVDEARLSHVHVNSFRHTLWVEKGSLFLEHSRISGDESFIATSGSVFLHNCRIESVHPGRVCDVTGSGSVVFHMCEFVPSVACSPEGPVALANPSGGVTTISCRMGSHIVTRDLVCWKHYQPGGRDNTLNEREVMALLGRLR